MAKDKSLKSETPKRKKLCSNDSEAHVEEMKESKEKKKRKRMDVEEAPAQIPEGTIDVDVKKMKKDKKRKKKQMTEQTEISDPPSLRAGKQETEGVEGEEDLSPEERRVMERKMKKILKKEEKKRLKDEGKTEAKAETPVSTASQHALDYLTCWATNRTEWKFQKTRQTWLLQHMFDSETVPDEKFSILLEYLEGLRGAAKDTTVRKALALVQESGQAPEDKIVQQRAHRAREAIQLLS